MVKLTIVLAVLGLVAYDGIAVIVAHVGGQGDAGDAAYAAAQTWVHTHDFTQTIDAARAAVPAGDTIAANGCTSTDGLTWTCTLTRPAHTVVMDRIGFLQKYTVATERGEGSYNS
jgi:hypothetical protein